MADKTDGLINLTEPALQSFPNLFEPKKVKRNGREVGEARYSDGFEFDNDSKDLAALKAHAVKVAKALFPGMNIGEEVKAGRFNWPFKSGDALADKAKRDGKEREWSRGKTVLGARSKYEPRLAVLENGALSDYEGDRRPLAKKFFYTGSQVLAEFNAEAYDGVDDGKPGVTFYLNMVVSLNKGARLTGGRSAAETFRGYVGIVSDVDPTAGDDDVAF